MIAKGVGASPGAAVGKVVFSAEDAAAWAARGEDVILVRVETSPEDVVGMSVSQGILTARGGATSTSSIARGAPTSCSTAARVMRAPPSARHRSAAQPCAAPVSTA